MTALTVALVSSALLVVAWYVFSPAVQAYRRFRGQLVVACPETGQAVATHVDARHLALSAVRRTWEMEIESCDQWPGQPGCDQVCTTSIEDAPEQCSVRERLRVWYHGKSCVKCGSVFANVDSYDHTARVSYDKKPALLSLDDEVIQWKDVHPVDLLKLLDTHQPICWDCATIETFRKHKPDWVIDGEFTYRSLHF